MNALILAALLCQATNAASTNDWDRIVSTTSLIQQTPGNYNHVEYLRACAYHGIGKKREATLHAKNVLDSIHHVERRHEVMCEVILRDMESWREGDLGEIDRLMRRSTDDLNNRRAPVKTQQEILEKLDRLIQEQEAPPKPDASSTPEQTPVPTDVPVSGGPSGQGKVDNKRLKQIAATWGEMPEHERQKVTQEILGSIPYKYRGDVEAYFKALSRSK